MESAVLQTKETQVRQESTTGVPAKNEEELVNLLAIIFVDFILKKYEYEKSDHISQNIQR